MACVRSLHLYVVGGGWIVVMLAGEMGCPLQVGYRQPLRASPFQAMKKHRRQHDRRIA